MPTREIRFRYTSIDGDVAHEVQIIRILCEAIVQMNEVMILANPDFFAEGLSRVRYIPPPSCRSDRGVHGCQPVKGIVALLESRQGTCIDLACAFCALRRTLDHDLSAEVLVTNENRTPGLYHTTVRYGQGQIFDPQRDMRKG
jgi:hypothetical protein